MIRDPETIAHSEWIGYVQPVGLVVSIPAMLAAQAHVNRHIAPDHQRFLSILPRDKNDEIVPQINDLGEFTRKALGWEPSDLIPVPASAVLPDEFKALESFLEFYNEVLRPTHAVREIAPKEGQSPWLMLARALPVGTDLDKPEAVPHGQWPASPQAKMERLLHETGVPIGWLFNGACLRLVYAPRGETSGYMTFSVAEMAQVAGRPIFAALHMLFSAERLFSLPEKQRLPAILSESRKYQNTVSTRLAEQVLAALYELLRGFQAANDQRRGDLLREVLADDPHKVYAGLLTVLMRMVFILFAEDRGLLSSDPLFANYYSIAGLFERLRAEAGRYPDTMDLRYGAWAQLLTLFRLIFHGGAHGGMRLPARKGYLFDPDRYPFLEGRAPGSRYAEGGEYEIPRVSDGVIYRVLEKLLILEGERLSYRTLDVEQIGSVYERMMGFDLEIAQGRSIAIKAAKRHGAPATINLEALLAERPANRGKWLKDNADQSLSGQAADALKNAQSIDDLLAALERKIDRNVTPNRNVTPHPVPAGAMVFQPSDERRRSGSHYTPRSLTEPIVRTTLRPILERLGRNPKPEEILDLKVCDPAMGSGAFLVEACRQLGKALAESWRAHNCLPPIPPDEDEQLHAQRIVAQHCLYGVDKNPMAVDLAKLSLWLATLAKDHAFTFLDHSLRCGDSLVGLTRRQIAAFHWNPPQTRTAQDLWFGDPITDWIEKAAQHRRKILADRDLMPYLQLETEFKKADESLILVRLTGDLVVSAFFSADRDRQRVEKLDGLAQRLVRYLGSECKLDERPFLDAEVKHLRNGDKPIRPFHWEIEFPEVFTRDNGGFDAIVGNPPFAGKNTLINGNREGFLDWLKAIHAESHGNADLVAHFYRRAFNLIRQEGCFGLIATNTIGQGDTRSTGLRWICLNGGSIYEARRRYKWPGAAAVVVSVVHIAKGKINSPYILDGKSVPIITAYLFHAGGHDDPEILKDNIGKSYVGSYILGKGFTFDDSDHTGVANSVDSIKELGYRDKKNLTRVFPYINGEETNKYSSFSPSRYIINFLNWPLERIDITESWNKANENTKEKWLFDGKVPKDYPYKVASDFPDLLNIVEKRVRPERELNNDEYARRRWWHFMRPRAELYESIIGLNRVLVRSLTSTNFQTFAFLANGYVYDQTLIVFTFDQYLFFSILISRVHEYWAVFQGATMKDDPRYNIEVCFETFPFPENYETDERLEAAGREYYEFRAQLMVANNEGLTKTYNRFHDPEETLPEILQLRELHAAMDRAVLDAYGWTDLETTCEFLLDYEEDEDEDDGSPRRRKKPWRYRWPDDLRDEVLARLLELNKQRAEQERLAGLAAEPASAKTTRKKAAAKTPKAKRAGKTNPQMEWDM